MRIFEKDDNGLLHELPSDVAKEQMKTRRHSQTHINCIILFTAREEAERDADEKAHAERHVAQLEEQVRNASIDPTEKMKAFLEANPDVVAALGLSKT